MEFTTPRDPVDQCVVDHACPEDPTDGDGGGEDAPAGDVAVCQDDGDDCCPGANCDPNEH